MRAGVERDAAGARDHLRVGQFAAFYNHFQPRRRPERARHERVDLRARAIIREIGEVDERDGAERDLRVVDHARSCFRNASIKACRRVAPWAATRLVSACSGAPPWTPAARLVTSEIAA